MIPYPSPTSAEQWAMDYLQWIGAPATSSNDPRVQWLVAQQKQEGNYPGTYNYSSEYNPLDTSMPESGSRSVNSSNVQGYQNVQQGLLATEQTMSQSYDSPIFNALRNRGSTLADLQAAQSQSNWAGGGQSSQANQSYAADISKILGKGIPSWLAVNQANATGGTSGPGVGFLHSLQAVLNPDLAPSLGANVVKDIGNIFTLPATDAGKIALAITSRGGFFIIGGLMVLGGAALLFVNLSGGASGPVGTVREVQRITQAPERLRLERQRAETESAREERLSRPRQRAYTQ